jgi:hypothetical protein
MSTNVVGVGASPAPQNLSRIAAVVVGGVLAVSIGIGIAQSDGQDPTLDRYHPGHPTVADDRQEKIADMRDDDLVVVPETDLERFPATEDPKRAPKHRR